MEPPVDFTGAPVDNKGPGATKAGNKASEPHPGSSSGTGSAPQPTDSSKSTIVLFSMWQKWPLGAEIVLIIISVTL